MRRGPQSGRDARASGDRALAAGATTILPQEPRFCGDIADLAGPWWWIAAHERTPGAEDIRRGAADLEAKRESSS